MGNARNLTETEAFLCLLQKASALFVNANPVEDLGAHMKNVYEVLREKELEVSRLQGEVEALRVAAPLLTDAEAPDADLKTATAVAQPLTEDAQADDTLQLARPAWGDRAKHWLNRGN